MLRSIKFLELGQFHDVHLYREVGQMVGCDKPHLEIPLPKGRMDPKDL